MHLSMLLLYSFLTGLCLSCDHFSVQQQTRTVSNGESSYSITAHKGSQICFENGDNSSTVKIDVVMVEEDFPIEFSYNFSHPQFNLDCSCQCGQVCQKQSCPNCFHITSFSFGSCIDPQSGSVSFYSGTCCVAKVLNGGSDQLMVYRLGKPTTVVTLQITDNISSVSMRVTTHNPTLRLSLGNIYLTLHLLGVSEGVHFKSDLVVIDGRGKMFSVPVNSVNTAYEWDPKKVGWFREDNQQQMSFVRDEIRVEVLDCERQMFNASVLAAGRESFDRLVEEMDEGLILRRSSYFVAEEQTGHPARSVSLEATLKGEFKIVQPDLSAADRNDSIHSVEIVLVGSGAFLKGVAKTGASLQVRVSQHKVRYVSR